ncbi:MAG: DUF4384 domain-containing protein [Planctomycetota bacterium]
MNRLKGILLLCVALFTFGCASSSEKQQEPEQSETGKTEAIRSDETVTQGTAARPESTPETIDPDPKDSEKSMARPKIADPKSLHDHITNLAIGIADQIPENEAWMIMVTVKGADPNSERFEDAVSNELIAQLQAINNERKCFMVTTPEIRKQIMEEQAETLNDMYNEETGVEIGNIVRADAILKVPLSKFDDHMQLSLQLISINTSAILWSVEGSIPARYLPKEEKINPEFLYSSYRSGSHAIRNFPMPANTAGLKVSVDRGQVIEGQTYNIECSTRAPGYLYLFDLQTDGTLAVLLPNRIPIESLNGGFLDHYLPANGRFSTRGNLELMASIAGKETILAVLTEHELDVSAWEKVYTKELGPEFPQYHWYTFGRNGTIRDCLNSLQDQLNHKETGYWFGDWKEFSIVR